MCGPFRHSASSRRIRLFGYPLDQRRPHGSAQRIAFAIGQTQTPDEQTSPASIVQQVGRDRIKPQLRSPEQREVLVVVDGAPGQIDESDAWRALDVGPPKVHACRRRYRGALDSPCGVWRIARNQVEQLSGPSSTLDPDVDVVISARTIRTGATTASWKIGRLNADLHTVIIG